MFFMLYEDDILKFFDFPNFFVFSIKNEILTCPARPFFTPKTRGMEKFHNNGRNDVCAGDVSIANYDEFCHLSKQRRDTV